MFDMINMISIMALISLDILISSDILLVWSTYGLNMVQNMFAKYGCVAEPCAGTRLGRLGRRWDDAGTTLHLALVALALVALVIWSRA